MGVKPWEYQYRQACGRRVLENMLCTSRCADKLCHPEAGKFLRRFSFFKAPPAKAAAGAALPAVGCADRFPGPLQLPHQIGFFYVAVDMIPGQNFVYIPLPVNIEFRINARPQKASVQNLF